MKSRGHVPTTCIDCGVETQLLGNRCAKHKAEYDSAWYARKLMYSDPVYKAQPMTGTCHICKMPIAEGEGSRDHVLPVVLGGTNVPTNILPAHKTCNSRAGARVRGT